MSPFVPAAVHRRNLLRDALVETADAHDMPMTVKHMGHLADAVANAMFPNNGSPDPALAIGRRSDRQPAGGDLNDIELAILGHLANGKTVPEIVGLTPWGENAIRSHLRRAYKKLGARNVTHAVGLLATAGVLGAVTPDSAQ